MDLRANNGHIVQFYNSDASNYGLKTFGLEDM